MGSRPASCRFASNSSCVSSSVSSGAARNEIDPRSDVEAETGKGASAANGLTLKSVSVGTARFSDLPHDSEVRAISKQRAVPTDGPGQYCITRICHDAQPDVKETLHAVPPFQDQNCRLGFRLPCRPAG